MNEPTLYISADRIHNGKQWLPDGTVLQCEADGTISNLWGPGSLPAERPVKHYPGVLCPGFVNAHCHVELSHLKGRIEEGTGLIGFVTRIMDQRQKANDESKQEAMASALKELKANGIVAVGDICNTKDMAGVRKSSGLHFHSFIECTGFIPEKAQERFGHSEELYHAFEAEPAHTGQMLKQSIVPHAPYSVSGPLMEIIAGFSPHALLSIHNQECEAENELFLNGEGPMAAFLASISGPGRAMPATGTTSLAAYLDKLLPGHSLILVHNTYMRATDLELLAQSQQPVYLCLCPRANLYIEGQLPPVDLFRDFGAEICLGTDSLSSNHGLHIWEEVLVLRERFPHIPLGETIRWATYNGAKALGMSDVIGSLETGKKPGLVHIADPTATSVRRVL